MALVCWACSTRRGEVGRGAAHVGGGLLDQEKKSAQFGQEKSAAASCADQEKSAAS